MNIFALSVDLDEAARWHVDRHIVKMPLETTQLLSNAYYFTGSEGPYRLTHKNHPASIYARSNKKNWDWLARFGLALCKEYTFRYGKTHKCEGIIRNMMENPPELDEGEFEFYKTVEEQKEYYKETKQHLSGWKGRGRPEWF